MSNNKTSEPMVFNINNATQKEAEQVANLIDYTTSIVLESLTNDLIKAFCIMSMKITFESIAPQRPFSEFKNFFDSWVREAKREATQEWFPEIVKEGAINSGLPLDRLKDLNEAKLFDKISQALFDALVQNMQLSDIALIN